LQAFDPVIAYTSLRLCVATTCHLISGKNKKNKACLEQRWLVQY
jgi:hypothetical protein